VTAASDAVGMLRAKGFRVEIRRIKGGRHAWRVHLGPIGRPLFETQNASALATWAASAPSAGVLAARKLRGDAGHSPMSNAKP